MPRNTLFWPKLRVNMTICTINVRITPKTHMNPYISRLVSNYGIRWNIYHMLLVKLKQFFATKNPFGPKIGVKITICTCHVRKTPNTHMKPDISRLVSIYGIGWNIYHVMSVKFRNSIPTNTLFCPKMSVKMTICTVMSKNT